MAHKILHVHDSLLGYVPRPGVNGTVRNGGLITIDIDGFRVTGESHRPNDGPIVAVGDSYTYGEDVGDQEAWPAQLQALTGRRVLNAGVSGYGLDQIVLRAERVVETHRPSVVIVSFIAEDIHRTEMRRLWWHDKPWFEIKEGQLTLKGVPVPNRTTLPIGMRIQIERALVKLPPVLQHLASYHLRVHRPGTGRAISLRLMERLARLQAEHHVRVIVVAQYDARAWIGKAGADEQRSLTRAMLSHAAASGLQTLDTYHRIAAEPERRRLYERLHLNGRGNRMIAHLVAAGLRA